LQDVLRYPQDLRVPAHAIEKAREVLRDPATLARIRRETLSGGDSGFSLYKSSGPASILILVCPGCEAYEGKFISEVAAEKQVDGFETVVDLLLHIHGDIVVSMGGFFEEDVRALMKQSWTMIASDGAIPVAGERAHPRFTGTFPRVLGVYVRELHWLTLEDAIRKMTSAPATFLGLEGRGRLEPGMAADIVVFDPRIIADRSTWKSPDVASVGVSDVLVNGVAVLANGSMTGRAPGRYLQRGGASQPLTPP